VTFGQLLNTVDFAGKYGPLLPYTAERSVGVDALPRPHRDPFDGLLVTLARAAE